MKKHMLIFILFILLTAAITFPLAFKFTTHIPGFFSTDEPYAAIWNSWRIKYSFENNLPFNYTYFISCPFGTEINSSGYVSYLRQGWFSLLSIFTTSVLTWNIQVILNILLSGFFAYLLVFYLTKNKFSSFLSGIIFAFCPYQFVRVWQHLGLTYNQWIPLVLLGLVLLKEDFSKKRVFLFLLFLILLLSFDFSIMYFGGIALTSFLVYTFFYCWRDKIFRKRSLIKGDFKFIAKVTGIILIAFLILSAQFIPIIKNRIQLSDKAEASGFNPYRRPFDDLFTQSAKPLSYLLPAVVHPVFGDFTKKFVGSHLYGVSVTEHTLYLGWIPLLLAFIAFRKWKIRRKKFRISNFEFRDYKKDNFYIGFFIFLAIIAWLFSQPPWWQIGKFRIYMPSFFMYKIIPMVRAYCRFGIVVMFAVAVLAGYGLKFILDKFKRRWVKVFMCCLFCGLVLFEFWNWPPYKVIDVSKAPSVYYWLQEKEGDFAIAEYPLDSEGPNEMYKFYQIFHNKPIINGTIPGTYSNKVAKTITDLSEGDTASVLSWMGVKYVLVHRKDYEQSGLVDRIEELKKIPENKGLKLIKEFDAQSCPTEIRCTQKSGPIDVYEVTAVLQKPSLPMPENISLNRLK